MLTTKIVGVSTSQFDDACYEIEVGVMEFACRYITSLVNQGGPDPSEYGQLSDWFSSIGDFIRSGALRREDIKALLPCFGDSVSVHTMQGFVALKPHGYAGDFEVIDRIYQHWLSPDPMLQNWDHFFHAQAAPCAVRNRKSYFLRLLGDLDALTSVRTLRVLNVGSGPGRDVAEYLSASETRIHFDCLDHEPKAVAYAQGLCGVHPRQVTFHTGNIFHFRTTHKYDLIWAGGVFDYLRDKGFVFLLRRLLPMVRAGGRLVVGNFGTENPSRDYMEFGEWFLIHRTAAQLLSLVQQACGAGVRAHVESEPSGVNLFLHAAVP